MAISKKAIPAASILIASENSADALLVQQLLHAEFVQVFVSTSADQASEDFERHRPDVLILAFDSLEKSERHYLGLFRRCPELHFHPHRTIILCSKDEVNQVYALCRKDHFDDYVLFWPMNNDAPRLPMAVHHALRDLATRGASAPSAAEFAVEARRLSGLEATLNRQMARGGQQIEVAARAIEQAEQGIDAALDDISRRLIDGAVGDALAPGNAEELNTEIGRLKRDEVFQPLRGAAASSASLKQWADDLMRECEPHMESARALNSLAERIQSTLLIVDDDELQRNMLAKILEAENYRLIFAASGPEALSVLRKTRPDLILMDVMMPDMSGVEATRRIKAVPRFAEVPIVMVTGMRQGNVVTHSLKAGATDFVVKPIDRDTLLAKVAKALGRTPAPPS